MGTQHPDGANQDDTPVDAQEVPERFGDPDDATAESDHATPQETTGEALTAQRRRALAEARRNAAPAPRESWRKRTATGAVLTGFALGFREALGQEPPKTAIIMEAPGDPPTDLPVDAEVDQIRPADNVVRIRPWLLNNGDPEVADGDSQDAVAADPEAPTGPVAPTGATATAVDSDAPRALPAPSTAIPERAPAPRRRGRR